MSISRHEELVNHLVNETILNIEHDDGELIITTQNVVLIITNHEDGAGLYVKTRINKVEDYKI